jgi:hypothetical protein
MIYFNVPFNPEILGLQSESSGKAPAYQAWGPEFSPCAAKKKKKKSWNSMKEFLEKYKTLQMLYIVVNAHIVGLIIKSLIEI